MLVRKENEIEIWNDNMEKGTGKRAIIMGISAMVFFFIIMLLAGCDFSIIETYYILGFLFFPCVVIIICGCIFIKRENEKYLVARINKDYVVLYDKKNQKQIYTKKITKINKISSAFGSFLVLFYNNNEKECQYSFKISTANKNLLTIAIKEYNNNVEISDKI